MFPLTTQEVEAAVQQYWYACTAKDADQQQAFYAGAAMLFTPSSKRIERACIVSMQRHREYLAKGTKLHIRVADVEVLPLGDNAAVAFYTLQLHAQRIPIEGTVNQRQEEHLAGARVTQVFERDGSGEPKIVHEHISMPET
jgi:ketosteroid isomerase-like protein